VDPPRLLRSLVHRELEAAGRILVVDRRGGGGLDEGGPGLDREDLRAHVPRGRVLDGRGRDELLPALQHPDRVVRLDRAVALLDDHELSVEEAPFGVVEALRRQPRQQHDVFRRAETLDRLGEDALARPALAEHDRRKRIVELARDGHEVEEALVGLLAHVAEGVDVRGHVVEQIRPLQEGQGTGALGLAHLRHGRARGLGPLLLGRLLGLDHESQKRRLHAARLDPEGLRGAPGKLAPAPGGVEIEGVHVDRLTARDLHHHAQAPQQC
jgi:hypothetical protein